MSITKYPTSIWGCNVLTLVYILPRKSFCSGSVLIRSFFNRFLPWAFSDSRLFLLAVSYAFLIRFSSSEFEAKSSDSYSSTTFQPSLLLSAILINFYRRWIEAFALLIKAVIRGFLLSRSFSREISSMILRYWRSFRIAFGCLCNLTARLLSPFFPFALVACFFRLCRGVSWVLGSPEYSASDILLNAPSYTYCGIASEIRGEVRDCLYTAAT